VAQSYIMHMMMMGRWQFFIVLHKVVMLRSAVCLSKQEQLLTQEMLRRGHPFTLLQDVHTMMHAVCYSFLAQT
jgi:hypothetical protein